MNAIRGSNVCRIHGGSAPQVKAAAARRLLEMVDPALTQLYKLMAKGEENVSLGAIKQILDRAGIGSEKNPLEPGESRLTFTLESILEIREKDPERWERIQQLKQKLASLQPGESG